MHRSVKKIALLCSIAILSAGNATYSQAEPATQHIQYTKQFAKDNGLIGEMPNGLVGHVTGAYKDEQLEGLIKSINKGRMIVYKKAAAKKRLPLTYIQAKAADKLLQTTGPGHYYYKNGRWNIKR